MNAVAPLVYLLFAAVLALALRRAWRLTGDRACSMCGHDYSRDELRKAMEEGRRCFHCGREVRSASATSRLSYQPFDPTLWTEENGRRVRYLQDPIDSTYLNAPRSEFVPAGMLPPEELELRAALANLVLASAAVDDLTVGDLLWRRERAKAARRRREEAAAAVEGLLTAGPLYQVAFGRIVNAMPPRATARLRHAMNDRWKVGP